MSRQLTVTLEVVGRMNETHYMSLRVNGQHIASYWGTAEVIWHSEGTRYSVMIPRGKPTYQCHFAHVDAIIKGVDYGRYRGGTTSQVAEASAL